MVRWVTPDTQLSRVEPREGGQTAYPLGEEVFPPLASSSLHASGMKTVKAVHRPAKACAVRPSDASHGKPAEGTATDWVTRGHLNLSGASVDRIARIDRHDGSMYSRANVSNTVSLHSHVLAWVEDRPVRALLRDKANTEKV